MSCTPRNTAIYSCASYPTKCFEHIRQFVVSARRFGYPIHFLNYKNDWHGWWHAKFESLFQYEAKWQQLGIEYFCWADACDSVFVKPFEELLEAANKIRLPKDVLLTAVDWYYPYTIGKQSGEILFRETAAWGPDGVNGYPCAGLMFGHIDAFRSVRFALAEIRRQADIDVKKLAGRYGLDSFDKQTLSALDKQCDQTLMHLYRVQKADAIRPDIDRRLLSNYIYTMDAKSVELEEMRRPKPQQQSHLVIGEACIIHGSPTFRLSCHLENFIDTI